MNQNKIFCIFLALTTIIITSCGGVTPVPSTIPIQTQMAYPTVTPNNAPLQTLPAGQYGAVKFSLEISRNGKTYEILLAYKNINQGPQTPLFPQTINDNLKFNDVSMKWVGDIDGDNETEYIVEIYFCEAYCSSKVVVFHYDALEDNYIIVDSINGSIKKYVDINQNGNPEIISQDFDYHFKSGGAGNTSALSPIKIYRYDGEKKKIIVVTGEYPDLIANDAKYFLERIPIDYLGGIGKFELSSYLYDMYMLNQQDEGVSKFKDACSKYIQPTTEFDPNWCRNYLSELQSILAEMKIGSQ